MAELERAIRRLFTRRRAIQREVDRHLVVNGLPERRTEQGSVWAVTMARNEADIIGHTIKNLLRQGIQGVIAVDNLSTDETPALLSELAAQDQRVFVGTDTLNAYRQERKMSRLAYLAHRAGADWVILFDADEFWFAEGSSVADALRAHPTRVAAAQLFDLYPLATAGVSMSDGSAQLRMHPEASSKKVAIRAPGWVWVDAGNHTAIDLERESPSPLRIAHVPFRSLEQRLRKVRIGAAALQAAHEIDTSIGHHWRDMAALDSDRLAEDWQRTIAEAKGRIVQTPTRWRTWADRAL